MNGMACCHKPLLQMSDIQDSKIRRAADGTLVSDTGHTAAQVCRLYDALLDRSPDPGGLTYWVNAIAGRSLSLEQAVDGFTSSQEFQNRYGNQDNAGFVHMLYSNVLGRNPDDDGFRNWLNAMDNGMSRSETLLGFHESAEYIKLSQSEVEIGTWMHDNQAAFVTGMYDSTLDRLPDAAELVGWVDAIEGGMTYQQAKQGFIDSVEFQEKFGNLDDIAFVQQLYRNVLDREGEAEGLAAWTEALHAGITPNAVAAGFLGCAEYRMQSDSYSDNGIWLY
jgi:hypothetical protein